MPNPLKSLVKRKYISQKHSDSGCTWKISTWRKASHESPSIFENVSCLCLKRRKTRRQVTSTSDDLETDKKKIILLQILSIMSGLPEVQIFLIFPDFRVQEGVCME